MIEKNLEAAGWGLFFIWVGISILAGFSFAVGLLGVGIITVGVQLVRKFYNLKLEGFWLIVGLLFIIGGIWELLRIEVQLVPILIIVAGIVILISIFKHKKVDT